MNLTIAIISDDILFWNLFIPLLDRKVPDLKINVCRNYQEINYMADQNNFSLIIIDGGIKNLSSIEIIQYIRSSKRILSPVWFFPEIKSDAYLHKSMLIGANRIITKPFDPYVVVDEIISLLSLK